MFARLKRLAAQLIGPEPRFDEDDGRVAAAVLLLQVAAVDGAIAASERDRLVRLLVQGFGLDAHSVEALIAVAERRDHETADIIALAERLRRRLALPERQRILAMMWAMARADGHLHEFEENLLARAAIWLDVAAPAHPSVGEAAVDHKEQ
jgi:uncharacterized tellurite resistance protein B-like protein